MIYMIATVRDKQNIIGFRLLDTQTQKTMETDYKSVEAVLKQQKAKIENITVEGKSLKGINGSLDRYPVVNRQLQLVGKSPVILLGKSNNKYMCSDYKGQMQSLDEEQLIRYSKVNGIANGKIVNNHLSAISSTKNATGKADGKKKLIVMLSKYLHEIMREPDGWGTYNLPNYYDITFNFECKCELELRQGAPEHPGMCSTINTVSFNLLKNGDWITIKDFEEQLTKLLKGVTFTDKEVENYFKA